MESRDNSALCQREGLQSDFHGHARHGGGVQYAVGIGRDQGAPLVTDTRIVGEVTADFFRIQLEHLPPADNQRTVDSELDAVHVFASDRFVSYPFEGLARASVIHLEMDWNRHR